VGTEKLYYQDPDLLEFQAALLRQEPRGEQWVAVLDRSAFYPEGGGQPADQGELAGLPVLDVQEVHGEILHILPRPLPVAAGVPVEGRVDGAFRFQCSQAHTGQHLMSASLLKACGFPTVSVHLGRDYLTIEIEARLSQESELAPAQELASRVIAENRPVRSFWIDRQELRRYNLRRPPPDRERLRLVEIEDFDLAACGGLHLSSTGQVGLLLLTGVERIRGRTRLQLKVGRWAFEECRRNGALVSSLSRELTCGPDQLLASVQGLRETLGALNARVGQLEGELARHRAEELYEQAERVGEYRLSVVRLRGESAAYASALFRELTARSGLVLCLTNLGAGGLQWLVGRSPEVPLPLGGLIPPLLPLIEGKGGGSDTRWQGSGARAQGEEQFLDSLSEAVRRALGPEGGRS
jgi:alanyl-tRNA synthetase